MSKSKSSRKQQFILDSIGEENKDFFLRFLEKKNKALNKKLKEISDLQEKSQTEELKQEQFEKISKLDEVRSKKQELNTVVSFYVEAKKEDKTPAATPTSLKERKTSQNVAPVTAPAATAVVEEKKKEVRADSEIPASKLIEVQIALVFFQKEENKTNFPKILALINNYLSLIGSSSGEHLSEQIANFVKDLSDSNKKVRKDFDSIIADLESNRAFDTFKPNVEFFQVTPTKQVDQPVVLNSAVPSSSGVEAPVVIPSSTTASSSSSSATSAPTTSAPASNQKTNPVNPPSASKKDAPSESRNAGSDKKATAPAAAATTTSTATVAPTTTTTTSAADNKVENFLEDDDPSRFQQSDEDEKDQKVEKVEAPQVASATVPSTAPAVSSSTATAATTTTAPNAGEAVTTTDSATSTSSPLPTGAAAGTGAHTTSTRGNQPRRNQEYTGENKPHQQKEHHEGDEWIISGGQQFEPPKSHGTGERKTHFKPRTADGTRRPPRKEGDERPHRQEGEERPYRREGEERPFRKEGDERGPYREKGEGEFRKKTENSGGFNQPASHARVSQYVPKDQVKKDN